MMISRRTFLTLTGASLITAPQLLRGFDVSDGEVQGVEPLCTASGARPNVILILCDDLGWGDLGQFWQRGRESALKIQTPKIDAAICQGAMMTSAYTTAPVCAPARASMVTGKHQGHCTLRDNRFDCPIDPRMTIGTVMQQAGYTTWHIGKWGIGGGYQGAAGHRAMACAAGFDYSYSYPAHMHGHSFYHSESDNIDSINGSPILENVSAAVYHTPEHWLKGLSTPVSGTDFAVDSGDGTASGRGVYYRRQICNAEVQYCYDTDLFTAKIKQLINTHQAQNDGKPFFCYACYTTVHGSGARSDGSVKNQASFHIPGNAYPALDGTDTTWGGGATWEKDGSGHLTSIKSTAETANTVFHANYPEDEFTPAQRRYGTNVQRLDDAMGDLLNFLKLKGLDENTLILFTSDNGPAGENLPGAWGINWVRNGYDSNGPFEGMKRWSYEGGLREPTWALWPGKIVPEAAGKTPKTIDFPFQFPSWMATLADVAGVPQPAACDGVSILPSLTGSGRQLPTRVYTEYVDGGSGQGFDFEQMVRDGDYVLVRNSGKDGGNVELYNVVTDIGQTTNLATVAAHADRVRYMSDLLKTCRIPTGKMVAATGCIEAYASGSAGRTARDADAVPATPCPGAILPKWQGRLYYDGAETWPWVPNFRTLLPESGFTASNFEEIEATLGKLKGAYGLSLRGWIEVAEEGEVTFTATHCPKGCHVWVHEAHIIDREAGDCDNVSISIKLAKGRHPVRIYLVKKEGADRGTVTCAGNRLV
ncbi:MAG: sulfatase-like hydrolase/transferase [Kiritimatiellae bacterium]|nr:sulfatase-like hydrolase/transferase [Kiritimatiellia bacterium]